LGNTPLRRSTPVIFINKNLPTGPSSLPGKHYFKRQSQRPGKISQSYRQHQGRQIKQNQPHSRLHRPAIKFIAFLVIPDLIQNPEFSHEELAPLLLGYGEAGRGCFIAKGQYGQASLPLSLSKGRGLLLSKIPLLEFQYHLCKLHLYICAAKYLINTRSTTSQHPRALMALLKFSDRLPALAPSSQVHGPSSPA
jgi:hypothetical protein